MSLRVFYGGNCNILIGSSPCATRQMLRHEMIAGGREFENFPSASLAPQPFPSPPSSSLFLSSTLYIMSAYIVAAKRTAFGAFGGK